MSFERECVGANGHFPPWVRHEHQARYIFAADQADGKVVVDCACGDGSCARLIAEQAREVYAFDISAERIEEARAATNADNVQFAIADAVSLPLPDATADLYVSLETIEHLPDEKAFLREVVRVLKPGGAFICSTPDRDVNSPGHSLSSAPWNRFHVREWSQSEFVEVLRDYFDRVDLYGQNPKTPALVTLRCRAGRQLPWHLVVRLNQALKLPRFLYDRLEHHPVIPVREDRRYEALTAVCRRPHAGESARALSASFESPPTSDRR